ncbi:hypothetical protein WAK64_14665 [Bacillus spongiae]|uniref:DUF3347 domain-containing protein n=1 Tax=Bacillus spongiae TaxID=2683610 RepID=A0ABU8HFY7_9BACI
MKKIVALFTLLLLTLGISSMTFAETSNEDQAQALKEIFETNKDIQDIINAAVEEGDKLYKEYVDNLALANDEESERLTATYNAELETLITTLQQVAEEMTLAEIAEASKDGIEAECEYILVKIGDREVLVDPIKIIDIA